MNGDYVCNWCHLIYCGYLGIDYCDLCGRKLHYESVERLQELEDKWTRQEKARGLSPDFAYDSKLRAISHVLLRGYSQ